MNNLFTVLVVEDFAFNQFMIEKVVKSLGCEVEVANNGKEALGILGVKHIDLVLLDLEMPELNGIDTLKRIRAGEIPEISEIPVIALTAKVFTLSEKQILLSNGFNGVLSKPFDIQDLKNSLILNLVGFENNETSQIQRI
ncbi:MAG: response regulator [Bacteroidetes bacterium]|nr:response regulator [Bacteroidota bacterium]